MGGSVGWGEGVLLGKLASRSHCVGQYHRLVSPQGHILSFGWVPAAFRQAPGYRHFFLFTGSSFFPNCQA